MPDFRIINADCIAAMREMADNSVDAIVTDPPYGLSDHRTKDVVECLRAWCDGEEYLTKKKGFMGKTWDSWVPGPEVWREALRVLKPGGHLLAFAGTRSMDLMCMAIRIAGFELRDSIGHAHDGGEAPLLSWCHGQGFPKSRNIGRDADLAGGIEREVVDRRDVGHDITGGGFKDAKPERKIMDITKGNSEFEGWGSALKPAWEPIILCRKPLDGTIAQNATKWGVGGINIDRCRVSIEDGDNIYAKNPHTVGTIGANGIYGAGKATEYNVPQGRFPANLCLSHSPECKCVGTKKVKGSLCDKPSDCAVGGGSTGKWGTMQGNRGSRGYGDIDGMEEVEAWECVEGCPIKAMDEQSGVSAAKAGRTGKRGGSNAMHMSRADGDNEFQVTDGHWPADTGGGASRFFYTAKCSKRDRDEGLDGLDFEKEIGHNRFDTCEVCGGTILQNPDRPSACRCETPVRKSNVIKGNFHPTVKPVALMRWLTRLVTPPNGLCLDPFAGSGSTGKACMYEGFNFIGIEQDAEYCKIAEARIRYAQNNAGKEPDKKKPTPRKPTTPKAAEQPAPEKPAPKPSAQVSIFEIDKS